MSCEVVHSIFTAQGAVNLHELSFEYLDTFKGIHFLVEFYDVEHLQSIDDAVDDLIICCKNNGGTLK